MLQVGQDQLGADRVDEIDLARDQRLQRARVAGAGDELGLEAVLAEIAAVDGREQRGNAGARMRHSYANPLHVGSDLSIAFTSGR